MKPFVTFKTVLAVIFAFMIVSIVTNADTIQIPQWYSLKAGFEHIPELNKPVKVNVELGAIIGNLNKARIKLIMPDGWNCSPEYLASDKVEEGKSAKFDFTVTPKNLLAQGSIVVEAEFDTPKASICSAVEKIAQDKKMQDGMKANINSWGDVSKRYTEIAFAILPEESFYPLTGDMWTTYADELAPGDNFKGPAYYKNSVVSNYLAQRDVEMYEKLQGLLKTDESLASKIKESGIDLNRKHFDYINGLYVLAVDAYENKDYQSALDLAERAGKACSELKNKTVVGNIMISAENLRGLVFWAQGQKRLAEDAFKKAFYLNRKNPVQRYVLRNIGLLMYASKDSSTALQMFNLAKDMKEGYTLLEKELNLIK